MTELTFAVRQSVQDCFIDYRNTPPCLEFEQSPRLVIGTGGSLLSTNLRRALLIFLVFIFVSTIELNFINQLINFR